MNLEEILLRSFGFNEFRPGQREIIHSLIMGHNTVGVLPTGTGKSLCYQFVGKQCIGHVIIISPLLSLMQDQVEQMKAKGEKSVIAINSFLSSTGKRTIIDTLKNYKYIFISPEMLQAEFIQAKLKKLKIALFVIDEAHCISQWGYDFRTDYQKLGEIRKIFGSPLTLALTATATNEVMSDIFKVLEIEDASIFKTSVDRSNISIKIECLDDQQMKKHAILSYLRNLPGPGVIYFSSKKLAEQMVEFLKINGVTKVMAYHSGMTHEDRILIQQQFIYGQIDYICATSAFGMGINKENIRFVIHYHMPLQLESYLQEIGRAGRDGKASIAILLYAAGDENLALQLIDHELPMDVQLNWLYDQLSSPEGNELEEMKFTEEIRLNGGFSEIQWRITKEFILTRSNNRLSLSQIVDSLKTFVYFRKKIKTDKIFDCLKLIRSVNCRRNHILEYFGEPPLSNRVSNCCDQCGIQIEDFYTEKQNGIKTNERKDDWQWRLTKLLTATENEF